MKKKLGFFYFCIGFVITSALGFMWPASASDSNFRTIIDKSGAEVVIPKKPKRIAIAADREFTEAFVAAGIIPIAVASQHEFAPFLKDALVDASDLVDLGHHREIDLEALAVAKPDLIVMRNIQRYGSPELYQAAIKIAPVVQLNSMIGIRELITDVGNIMGSDVAKKLNQRVDAAVAKMANAVESPASIRVSHGSVYPGELSLFKDNTNVASQLIKEAGYARPVAQISNSDVIDNDSTKFSLEFLHQLDGDILFLNQVGKKNEVNDMLSSNLWSTLQVVKNNAVITSDWRYWNVGGVMAAEKIAEDFVEGLKKAGLKD